MVMVVSYDRHDDYIQLTLASVLSSDHIHMAAISLCQQDDGVVVMMRTPSSS